MYLSSAIFLSRNNDIFSWLLQEHMAKFETSNVLHHNNPQTKVFLCFSSCARNLKSFMEYNLTKRFWRKFSKGCTSLVSICCVVPITKELTVFVKLSILSNKESMNSFSGVVSERYHMFDHKFSCLKRSLNHTFLHTANASKLIDQCFLDLRKKFLNQENIRKIFSSLP